MARSKAYTEDDLRAAISEVEKSASSITAAAKRWGIPRRILQHSLAGVVSHQEASEVQMRLRPSQEQYLKAWIKQLDAEFRNPTHAMVLKMVEKIAGVPLGKRWLTKFVARHYEIGTVNGRKIDIQKINGTTKERMEPFFINLKALCDEKKIRPENIWNIDETGIATGLSYNRLVMEVKEKQRVYVQEAGDREWITITHAVSAGGRTIKQVVIFRGSSLQAQWFPDGFPNWHFICSPKGWTSTELTMQWLKKAFLQETKPVEDEWRLLILDGHSTHDNIDFMYECFQNKVACLFLLSHSSHVLQPLDLSIFSPLKTYYRQEVTAFGLTVDSAPVLKAMFVTCYDRAYVKAFTPKNIKSGLNAAGIYPFRPS